MLTLHGLSDRVISVDYSLPSISALLHCTLSYSMDLKYSTEYTR